MSKQIYKMANLEDGTLSKVIDFVEDTKVLYTEHGNIWGDYDDMG